MPPLPLEHVRAIVLTQAWAGTLATQLLGDLGADVIQVEALRRPDVWRGGFGPDDLTGVYPDDEPGERPYNRCARFNSVNRNKRGITLDLGTPEGKNVFLALVERADIVAENFSSRVMHNFGLGYEALHQIKPDIIVLSMPAYGHTGPYAAFGGIGGTAEPMSGLSSLQDDGKSGPLNSGIMLPDPLAGLMGAAAALIALHHRQRTGEGQFIDLALQETSLMFIGEHVLAHSMTGRVPQPLGNRDAWMAPHGTYPCLGEDAWVSLAVRSDAEWVRLGRIIGQPWVTDARFATVAGRREYLAALDAHLTEWSICHNPKTVVQQLQNQEIPCAMVYTPWTVTENPQLQARGFFEVIEHPEAGTHIYAGIPWKMSRTPGRVRRPPPALGQHNEEVLGDFLGLSAEDIARLTAQGITGRQPQRPQG